MLIDKVGPGDTVKTSNLSYLLCPREKEAIKRVKQLHMQKKGYAALKNPELFVYLADSQTSHVTWSAMSGRIPTLRCKNALMWHVPSNSWLTNRGKLLSLGFPASPDTAAAMGTPMVPILDPAHAGKIAGNSFHFSTIGVIQMLALGCFKVTSGDDAVH